MEQRDIDIDIRKRPRSAVADPAGRLYVKWQMWHSQVAEADLRTGMWLDDMVALSRCGGFVVGFPDVIIFARRSLDDLDSAYDQLVAPAIDRAIADMVLRSHVNTALHAMSMKMGMAMLSYARLTCHEQRFDVAALAGAVTRLYDDLIDGSADSSVDDRLGELFNARPFTPASDLERLLDDLVSEIRNRVEHIDAALTAVNALHEYQNLSRRQREPGVSPAMLQKICNGKGAMANLTLCSLVNPRLTVGERELVMALGETFQSLDDYMDVKLDAGHGVITLAGLGVTSLAGIGGRLRALRPLLVTYYGGRATRRYCGMIYFALQAAVIERRLPLLGKLFRRLIRQSALNVFAVKGKDAIPAAPGPVTEGRADDWCAD